MCKSKHQPGHEGDPNLATNSSGSNSFGGRDTSRVTVSAQNLLMEDASAIQAVALSTGASRGLAVTADTMMLNRGASSTLHRARRWWRAFVITARKSSCPATGSRRQAGRRRNCSANRFRWIFSNAYSKRHWLSSSQYRESERSDGAEISSSSARSLTGYGGVVRIVASGDGCFRRKRAGRPHQAPQRNRFEHVFFRRQRGCRNHRRSCTYSGSRIDTDAK